jgi:hypothetical protein
MGKADEKWHLPSTETLCYRQLNSAASREARQGDRDTPMSYGRGIGGGAAGVGLPPPQSRGRGNRIVLQRLWDDLVLRWWHFECRHWARLELRQAAEARTGMTR